MFTIDELDKRYCAIVDVVAKDKDDINNFLKNNERKKLFLENYRKEIKNIEKNHVVVGPKQEADLFKDMCVLFMQNALNKKIEENRNYIYEHEKKGYHEKKLEDVID